MIDADAAEDIALPADGDLLFAAQTSSHHQIGLLVATWRNAGGSRRTGQGAWRTDDHPDTSGSTRPGERTPK
jgi:hypothetical protein